MGECLGEGKKLVSYGSLYKSLKIGEEYSSG